MKSSLFTERVFGQPLKDTVHDPVVDRKIQHLEVELPAQAEKEGELLARIKKPSTSETKLTPAEQGYVDTIQGVVEQNRSRVGGKLQTLYQQGMRIKQEIERQGLSFDNRQQQEIDQVEIQQEKALLQTDTHFQGKIERANEQMERCHEQHSQAQHQLALISPEAQYGFHKAVYILVLIAVFLGEIPQLFASFLAFGWNIAVVVLLVMGVSASQCLIAHFLGMYAKQSNAPQKKQTIRLVAIGMLVFFLATGLMRIGELGSFLSLIFFTILNTILFFAATWASMMFHPKNKEAFQKKQRLTQEVAEKANALFQAEARAEDVQRAYEAEYERIRETHTAQIEALQAHVHPLIREDESIQSRFFDTWQYGQAIEQQAVAIKNLTIQRFRQANYATRMESERPPYWNDPLPELHLYFENFNEFFDESNQSHPSAEPAMIPRAGGFASAAVSLLMLVSATLGGCQLVDSAPVTSKVVAAIDVTDSLQIPVHQTAEHLLALLEETPGSKPPNHYEASFFLLEDVSLNHRYQTEWDYGSVLENPQKREQRKQAFVDHLDDLMSQALDAPYGRQYSRLYLPLCRCLNELAQDDARYKRLVIFSNLLENSEVFSAYETGGVEALLNAPDSVMLAFQNECQLEPLTGIEIIIVHRPDRSTDRLVLHMQRLYQSLLETKGARVNIKPNL